MCGCSRAPHRLRCRPASCRFPSAPRQYYLNRVLGSTAVRGLQRLPLRRGSWRVWRMQYPGSVALLAALSVAGLAFLALVLWLIFGLKPLPEDDAGGEGGGAAERKKDR